VITTATSSSTVLPPVVVVSDRGVSGGHFDFDSYDATKNKKHEHEYDDKFNVTGVNMLDPGQAEFALSKFVGNGTSFKVIAGNQYLNPAVELHIGKPGYDRTSPLGYVPISTYSTQATAAEVLAALPSYNLGSIKSFAINMPLDAFSVQSWWGSTGIPALPADLRVGLHPTETGCVHEGTLDNGDRVNALTRGNDANGVLHNGALFFQVIKSDTPATALELNVPGHPQYGWRVKTSLQAQYVLARFTTFWHHPDKACFSDSKWVKNPPQDPSTGTDKSSGGTDPNVRSFGPRVVDSGTGGTGGGDSSIITVTNPDGSVTTTTTTIIVNADGSITTKKDSITSTIDTTSIEGQPCTVGGASCASLR